MQRGLAVPCEIAVPQLDQRKFLLSCPSTHPAHLGTHLHASAVCSQDHCVVCCVVAASLASGVGASLCQVVQVPFLRPHGRFTYGHIADKLISTVRLSEDGNVMAFNFRVWTSVLSPEAVICYACPQFTLVYKLMNKVYTAPSPLHSTPTAIVLTTYLLLILGII